MSLLQYLFPNTAIPLLTFLKSQLPSTISIVERTDEEDYLKFLTDTIVAPISSDKSFLKSKSNIEYGASSSQNEVTIKTNVFSTRIKLSLLIKIKNRTKLNWEYFHFYFHTLDCQSRNRKVIIFACILSKSEYIELWLSQSS